MGKGGVSFPGGHDYLNIGMCGSLLAQILIFLPTLFVHFAYVTGGKKLTNFLCLFFLLGIAVPFPSSLQALEIIYSLKVFIFPASGDDTHQLSRAPPFYTIIVSLVQNAWKPYQTRLKTTGSVGEICLLLPPCLGLMSILLNTGTG